MLSPEQLLADAANTSDTLSLPNGASIRVAKNDGPRTLQVGAEDPQAYITSQNVEALSRQAEFLVDRINALIDPTTGTTRRGFEQDREKLVLQLHAVQRSALYEQTVGEARRREAARSPHEGIAQMKAELEWQERRTQDATAKALDELFGPISGSRDDADD